MDKQPAIISLTTMAAALAVSKLLALAGLQGEEYGTRTQIDMRGAIMVDDCPAQRPHCICHAERGHPLNRR